MSDASSPHFVTASSCRGSVRMERILLAAVLLLAAALRLAALTITSFAFDEARLAQLALRTARNADVATMGLQSSAGVPNFPLAVWIYALPFAASADPVIAVLFTGLLNVAGVVALWLLVRRSAGPWAGLTTAALYAGAPFAVHYSRAIWAQDLLGPLAIAWAWAAVASAEGRGRLAPAALVALTGLAPQLHYAGAALAVPALWVILRYRLWRRPLPLLAGALVAIGAALPFLWTLWRSGALGAIREAAARVQPHELAGLRRLLEMAVGRGWEWFLLGPEWRWPSDGASVALQAASGLVAAMLAAGAVAVALRLARRRPARPLDTVLPLWAVSAPLLFLGLWTPAYHQYQLASLPALFAVAGYSACLSARRYWGPAVAVLAVLAATVQGAAYGSGLGVVAERLTPGGMGTPLAYPRAAARALSGGNPVVVHAHGDEEAWVGDVAGMDVLLWGTPHRTVDGRSVLLIPTPAQGASARLFFTYEDLPAAAIAQELAIAAGSATFPRRIGEPPYVTLTPGRAVPALREAITPTRLANGAVLTSWQAEWRDGTLRVLTAWRIESDTDGAEYHQYHHLRTSPSGEPDRVVDVTVSSRAWRAGDTVIVAVSFPDPPPAALWVDTGMYAWPDVTRVPVAGRTGDPLAPIRLRIPPPN